MEFNTTLASYTPRYVTAGNSFGEDPLRGSWYTASRATGVITKPGDRPLSAFDTFSATCLYFGAELIDARAIPHKHAKILVRFAYKALYIYYASFLVVGCI